MRIIGGKLKGRVVEAPRGLLSRPPLSVIRESVFNTLGESILGKSVLDLFAGSGSLGIEALSRGAGRAQFVDSARRCSDMIERNAKNLGISELCRVSRQDAVEFVRVWSGERFDLVFMDPPFLSGKVQETVGAMDGSGLVSAGALVIARIHWREQVSLPPDLKIVRKRKFGDSLVLFLSRAGEVPAQ
ncbi:MAG: 16S rRNA (guanine(966)-N(2))-methyltransferase RsmD [bacterium]